jgi:hypothetical protein
VPPYLDLSGGLQRLRRDPRCWRTPVRDGGPDRFAVRRHHREQIRPIGPRTPSAAQLEAVAHALACTDPQSVFSKSATLSDLTDEQLCKRWPPSYRASQRRASALKLISGLAERQVYHDELEHRKRRLRGLADGRPRKLRRTLCRTWPASTSMFEWWTGIG